MAVKSIMIVGVGGQGTCLLYTSMGLLIFQQLFLLAMQGSSAGTSVFPLPGLALVTLLLAVCSPGSFLDGAPVL